MQTSILSNTSISAFMSLARTARLVVIGLIATLLGCAIVPERNPLPLELTNKASIAGIPDARFWGDEWPKYSLQMFETSTDAELRKNFSGIYGRPHNYLAISGGGANGAFGAGSLGGDGGRYAPGIHHGDGGQYRCPDGAVCVSRFRL
jgi:hypothetical protein